MPLSETQIIDALYESQAEAKTDDTCRRHGINSATFHCWRKKYGYVTAGEDRYWNTIGSSDDGDTFRALDAENAKLSRVFEDQRLDMWAMKDQLKERW